MPRVRGRTAAVDGSKPLPPCAGPKLGPFRRRKAGIRFLSLLGNPKDYEDEPDGYVFEVEIGSKPYALKMFRFFELEEYTNAFFGRDREIATDKVIECHFDPFYAECRAFGQIETYRLNGEVACDCYGYMGVPASFEDELRRRFGATNWQRPSTEDAVDPKDRQPFRAIVKELIREDTRLPLTKSTMNKMKRRLKHVRNIGVFPRDIHLRNYKDARLVDFSVAYTIPHVEFIVRKQGLVKHIKEKDLVMFDEMIERAGVDGPRMLPNRDYCQNLRSHKKQPDG